MFHFTLHNTLYTVYFRNMHILLKACSCPFVKIKFKDFQGPYEGYIWRTKLTQTGTFISIYKHQ